MACLQSTPHLESITVSSQVNYFETHIQVLNNMQQQRNLSIHDAQGYVREHGISPPPGQTSYHRPPPVISREKACDITGTKTCDITARIARNAMLYFNSYTSLCDITEKIGHPPPVRKAFPQGSAPPLMSQKHWTAEKTASQTENSIQCVLYNYNKTMINGMVPSRTCVLLHTV